MHLYIHAFFGQGWKTREMLTASCYINNPEQTARGCGRSAPQAWEARANIYPLIPAFFGQGWKTREMLVASCYIDSREQTARDCGRSAPHGRSDRNADRLIVYQRTGVSRLPAAAGGLPRVGGQDKHLYILRADCP